MSYVIKKKQKMLKSLLQIAFSGSSVLNFAHLNTLFYG